MRRWTFPAAALLLATATTTMVPGTASADHAHRHAARAYDFDGNGFPDLVTGLPTLEVRGRYYVGGVVVYYSSAAGVSRHGHVITQSSKGVPGASEDDDWFGSAVTSADFNRDGYADLAIGATGETTNQPFTSGAVTVLYGSRDGLGRHHTWRYSPGHLRAAYWNRFGDALVAADFTGDGYPDLAVGAPSVDTDDAATSGAVMVLRGGPAGVTASNPRILRANPGDQSFGSALAAGKLHGSHRPADLVVAAEDERWPRAIVGSVTDFAFGRDGDGRLSVDRQVLMRGSYPLNPSEVTIGDVLGDGHPDVIVGQPYFGSSTRHENGYGRVLVFRGTRHGPVTTPLAIDEATPGVPGTREYGDLFGSGVTVGDVDHDGKGDIVVWAPGDHADIVVHGANDGVATTGNDFYRWDGSSPRLVDYNRDGRFELTTVRKTGARIYRPAGSGFTRKGSQVLRLTALGVPLPLPGYRYIVLGRMR